MDIELLDPLCPPLPPNVTPILAPESGSVTHLLAPDAPS